MPRPQKRDFDGNYTWVMSPRWFDKRTGDHLALDTGGGPIARFWATALAGLVDIGYVKATGHSVKIYLPKTAIAARGRVRVEDPEVEQRHRARPRAHLLPGVRRGRARCYFVEQALAELHAGRTKTWTEFKVPDEAIGCGFHEAVRGVLSHHVVIRDGKIANYHPYPPTPWNANPRDIYGTPGPYEDAVQNTPIFEENGPDNFKGIDIMRAVRSFDPCLPCGVHMYLGNGKVLETHHSPMFGTLRRRRRRNRRSEGVMPRQTEFERRIAAHRRAGRATRDRGRPAPLAPRRRSWSARSWSCTAPALERMLATIRRNGAAGATIVDQLAARRAGGAACCCCTTCTRSISRPGCAARSRRPARTSSPTAATSSWSAHRRSGACGSGCRGAATAAPPRPSR